MDVDMRDAQNVPESAHRHRNSVRSPGPSLKRDRERDSPKSSHSVSLSPRSASNETSRQSSNVASSNRSPHASVKNQAPTPPRSRSPPTPTQQEPAPGKPPSVTTAKKARRDSSEIENGHRGGDEDDDYKSGIVVCGTCRARIPFRDPATGAFSLKRWDEHREACKSSTSQTNGEPGTAPSSPPNHTRGNNISPTSHLHMPPSSTHHHHRLSSAASYPPSGSPRILNSPPSPSSHQHNQYSQHAQHAQNSQSEQQQQKKRRAKRTERERIEYLASDPYVAEFEAYRVRCGACQRWIRLRPNSTYCSIPWDAHRRSCLAKRGGGPAVNGNGSNAARKPLTTKSALPMPPILHRQNSYQSANSTNEYDVDADADADADGDEDAEGEDDDTLLDGGGGPPPSASSYTSSHHHGNGNGNTHGHSNGNGHRVHPSGSGFGRVYAQPPASTSASFDDEGSDEDDLDAEGEMDDETQYANTSHQHQHHHVAPDRSMQHHRPSSTSNPQSNVHSSHSHSHSCSRGYPHPSLPQINGARGEGVFSVRKEQPHHHHHSQNHHTHHHHKEHHQQPHDLVSREGRLAFIMLSVRHLFRTSYDARAGDELTAMALVNYLNAALPVDKHEEFDLPEVIKAVAGALRERGLVKLEGDVVRLVG